MGERPASSFPRPSTAGRAAQERLGADTQADGEGRAFPRPAASAQAEPFTDSQFFRRTLLVAAVTVMTGVLLALIWYAGDIFLLMFGGVLFAVLLRAPANWLVAHTPLGASSALSLSIVLVLGGLLGMFYLFAFPLAGQIANLIEALPQAFARMHDWLGAHAWARPLQPLVAELANVRPAALTLGRATWILSSTASAVGALLVVIFIGIYLAAQPRLYQRGLMHLLPRRHRPRAYEVLDEIGIVLRRWLVGRIATMILVGLASGVGLWWLGVPFAITLGALSGLLEFIPYIGPVLAAGVPLLIAFNLEPSLVFYVAVLYVAIQTLEGYLLTPLVEQHTVSLPPALVVFATILLAALAGPVGVVLASPLTASCIVAVRLLYVEDVVEQPLPV